MIEKVTNEYEHALQAVYYHIGNRGIRVDTNGLKKARAIVSAEISRNLAIASNQWGCKVFIGAENNPTDEEESKLAVNLNATQGKYAFLKKLKDLGYNVPKIAKKNEDGDYESEYSTGELALQRMLSTNQFNYPGGDPAIKATLKVRELGKLKSSYLNARLLALASEHYYLSNYNVAGTLSGRRSSRKHTFGFGNNGQNFPKHSDIAALFLQCLIPRQGHVFLMVDQIQAEDWPVSALAYNLRALEELKLGIDRHSKLASAVFSINVPPKGSPTWDEVVFGFHRFMGKKLRHASNYDMTAPRMSDALAQEGHSLGVSECKVLLDKVAILDPNVKGVFHRYVRDTISREHILITPFGRERQILGARPDDVSSSTFKEAYAHIPQSTVADNTGFSVLKLETEYPQAERYIVQEGHDSVVQDVPSSVDIIYRTLLRTVNAFDRRIRFYNGIEIQIPLEAELGLSFKHTVKIKTFTRAGIAEALQKLQDTTKAVAA